MGQITKARMATAISAAIAADIAQTPANLAVLSGLFALEGFALDLLIDFVMAGLTNALLGFHWALLPTCLIEAIPVVDIAPTWTGCVSLVAWQRRNQLTSQSAPFPAPSLDEKVVISFFKELF